MEHMQDKEFDKKLQEKIGAFTPKVPEHLWDNIVREVHGQPVVPSKRNGAASSWLKIAASIAVVLTTITLYVKRPHEVIYLSGKKAQQIEQKGVLQSQTPAVVTAKNEGMEWNTDKSQNLRHEAVEQKTLIEVATQNEKSVPHQPFDAEIKGPDIVLVKNEAKLPEHIASLPLILSEPVEEERAKKNKKGFAVSDVLNYVVASVNQGDKKVISFANDDEGILKVALDLKALKTKL
jgi:hypothetical protein